MSVEKNSGAKEPKKTRLIIGQEVGYATNHSTGVSFDAHPISINRSGGKLVNYFDLKNLSNTSDVEVYMEDGPDFNKLDLPEKMKTMLAQYLRDKNQSLDQFDCFSFAHYINGIPYEFGHFKPELWHITDLHEEELKPGDTLYISHSEDPNQRFDITHFAVYLGNNLYISKFYTGSLLVTSLSEMKKGFGGEYVFKAEPKTPNKS